MAQSDKALADLVKQGDKYVMKFVVYSCLLTKRFLTVQGLADLRMRWGHSAWVKIMNMIFISHRFDSHAISAINSLGRQTFFCSQTSNNKAPLLTPHPLFRGLDASPSLLLGAQPIQQSLVSRQKKNSTLPVFADSRSAGARFCRCLRRHAEHGAVPNGPLPPNGDRSPPPSDAFLQEPDGSCDRCDQAEVCGRSTRSRRTIQRSGP